MAGVQVQARVGWPRYPHLQGFMAAASINRQGKAALPCTRLTVTTRSSSGWRRASSASRENSGSSSKNSTPLWARLTSPGRGTVPPPDSADALVVWCGLRKGRAFSSPPPGKSPATE